MNNNNDESMIDNQHIQSLSYSKLAEYDQTRIDLPIRKYVLITNLLREPISPQNELEQQWFDTCINELDKEDEDIDLYSIEEEEEEEMQDRQDKEDSNLLTRRKYHHKQDIYLHTFYNFRNSNGFLICTSNL